jgi:hypothetical protein
MSSSASGPYQSKFFNFLNRQSLKWRDRLETTARHLKVTVEWGVQILLYPAYLLVQAGRMAGRELEQIATRAQLSAASADEPSPTTTSDRPITEVLSALPLREKNEPAIQGIASLLDSRRLALVTAENSLLDVLSPEQQKTLLTRIRTEVANYSYERRLAEAEKPKLPGAIPNFEGAPDKILPPARWFWKVMRWVQRSPVALAANVFGESRLKVGSEPTGQLSFRSLSPTPAFLANLDRQIAQWEIAPLATAKQLFRQIQTLSQQRLQPLVATTNSTLPAHPQTPIETTDPFSLQALILAAVDYFFGERAKQAGIGGGQQAVKGLTGQVQVAFSKLFAGVTDSEPGRENRRRLQPDSETVAETEDPWVSWEELFTELSAPVSGTAAPLPIAHSASLPSGLPVPKQEEISRWKRLRQNLGRSRWGKLRHSPTKVTNHLTKQEAAGLPTRIPPSPTEIVPAIQEPNTLETAFDWLEAKVTSTGYVKHPLEQILAWLDRLVLWLEQLLTKLMSRINSR